MQRYPPNGFGLFNMTGNVGEWCAHWFGVPAIRARPVGVRRSRLAGPRPAGGAWRVAPVPCLLSRAPPGAFPPRQYARRQRRAQGVPDRERVAPKLTQRRADPRSWRPAPRTGS
ncbi:MAG: SUMF1/EgtB/PvdO family nonheme iron enzyme [Paracoccaceae bacterium]